jgi:hypothetical protein
MQKRALHTSEEAVVYLGLDRVGLRQPLEALRWLRRTGKLRFTKIGRRVFFRADWLDEAIEENSILRQPRPTK